MRFFAAVVAAIELWEPRFRARAIDVVDGSSAEQLRGGRMALRIRVEYRPRGHLGDPTPDWQERSLTLSSDRRTVA